MPSPLAPPPSTAPSRPAKAVSPASFRTFWPPVERVSAVCVTLHRFSTPLMRLTIRNLLQTSENHQILVAFPIGDVAAEAGEFVALHRQIELQEFRPQHAAEDRIGVEIGERLLQAVRQFAMRGILLARPLGLGLKLQLALDAQQPRGQG